MEKIVLTPDYVKGEIISFSPKKITISKNGIHLTESAAKALSVKVGCKFVIEIEDNKIYYKDSAKEGFELTSSNGKPPILKASCYRINELLNKIFKKERTSYSFTIGEFIEGRRELKLMSTIA